MSGQHRLYSTTGGCHFKTLHSIRMLPYDFPHWVLLHVMLLLGIFMLYFLHLGTISRSINGMQLLKEYSKKNKDPNHSTAVTHSTDLFKAEFKSDSSL